MMQISFLLFPQVTQLDMAGPAQVLSRMPGAKIELVAKTLDPVPTDAGFQCFQVRRSTPPHNPIFSACQAGSA